MNIRLISILIVIMTMGCNKVEHAKKNAVKPCYSTQEVREQIIDEEIVINGKIEFDQRYVGKIYAKYGGVVKSVLVEIGDYVRKGDVVAVINSGEIADIEMELKNSNQRIIIAENALKVAQDMNNSGIGSKRDLMIAQQEYKSACAQRDMIQKTMQINDIRQGANYVLKSPVNGFVVEKSVTKDMFIRSDNNDAIFTISGIDEVLVNLSVYESDISKIKVGDMVVVRTVAYPDKEFEAKIEKISNMIDLDTKTMTVRVRLSNKDFMLKPGMFASVHVRTNEAEVKYPKIDAKAVIFNDGDNYVVVENDNKYQIRKVVVFKEKNKSIYVKEGLKEGERVINKNALLVYNSIVRGS